MYRTRILICAALTIAVSSVHLATAAVIDFETTPAGVPTTALDDDTPVAAPYNITGGGTVQFFFDNNGDNTLNAGDDPAIFEQTGAEANNAFSNAVTGVSDTATPPYAGQLGSYFLRAVAPGPPPNPFIIDYNTSQTIVALSGEIWDIDGQALNTEQWQVDVLDAANLVLATTNSPLGNSMALDGEPWTFAFTSLPLGVDKVRLTFIGSKTNGVGLAFNNFSPTIALPEPSAIALLAVGALPLALMIRRSRRA